ncbi:MAG: single-stranded-DNA-specific exonuclease RecJ [Patescibacteria group bacterium]
MARLLLNRRLDDPDAVDRFLHPDLARLHPPALLPGLPEGLARLAAALRGGEKILIFGDYDADGVTAVSLLMRLLQPLAKGRVFYYVPKRLAEGYGLSLEALERAARHGINLVLTVDCGISARAEIAAARALGLDVIVTDHHQPGPDVPEEAVAVIDPKLPGAGYPFTELAGVGLAFKLGQGLAEMGLISREELLRHLDLVALGTVADIVPLVDENRILAHFGLEQLNHTENPGLRALLDVVHLQDREITAGHIGFVLAPRLNASGRLGDAALGVRLLLAAEEGRAEEIARALERENEERQRIEAKVLAEAVGMIEAEIDLSRERAIVLASPDWHPGVIGIVASRLVEAYYRPVILVSMNGEEGRGSGRSIPGFNLHRGLSRCASHLVRFGGHEAAAGLTVRREAMSGFTVEFLAAAREELLEGALEPTLRIEAEIGLDEVTLALAREVARLAPHGAGNPSPVLACRGARLIDCRSVGENGRHLKVKVAKNGAIRDGIGFSLGAMRAEAAAGGLFDLAFTVEENTFNGATDVQLNLRDLVKKSGDLVRAASE